MGTSISENIYRIAVLQVFVSHRFAIFRDIAREDWHVDFVHIPRRSDDFPLLHG